MTNPLVIPVYVAIDRDETGKVVTVLSKDLMEVFKNVEIDGEQPSMDLVQYAYFEEYMDELFSGNDLEEFSKHLRSS